MGSGKGGVSAGGGGGGVTTEGPAQAPEAVPTDPTSPTFSWNPDDPTLNPGGQLTGPGVKAENLAPGTQESIRAYTGEHIPGGERFKLRAEELNRILRGNTSGFEQAAIRQAKAYKRELNQSLSKVRNYSGETYRVINDSAGDIAAKYTPGKIVRQQEFLSTSRSPSPSYQPFASARSGQTRFTIQSKSGKLVEKISKYKEEMEVLFRSGTKFKVTSKTWNPGRETWDVSLTEL